MEQNQVSLPDDDSSQVGLSVEDYIRYVQETQKEFSEMGNLISAGEVSPDKVNRALARFWKVSGMLASEYNRVKVELANAELTLEMKTDGWFEEARQAVIDLYRSERSIKPAVKEYEIQMRRAHAEEYYALKGRITDLEIRKDFLLRLRETLNKMDSILVTLSANMRSELKALSTDARGRPSQVVAASPSGRTRIDG